MASELQSAERTLSVLELLAERPGTTLSEIAQTTGLPLATTHRIARMLTAKGYIGREPDGRRYRLTGKMLEVGARGYREPELLEVARPALEELRDATGETAHLAVLSGEQALVVASVEGRERFRVCTPPGACDEVHCTAIGKALAAFQDPPLIPTKLKRFTPNTITGKRAFAKELELVRQSGLAFDREEAASGVCCLAAPVFDRHGKCIAAVGVSGPASRLSEKEGAASKAVVAAAKRVSAALGNA